MTDPHKPSAVAIADDLQAAIRAGKYPPGTQLPSHPALAAEYGYVSTDTVKRAMALLRDRGLVEYIQGRGYWVTGHDDSTGSAR